MNEVLKSQEPYSFVNRGNNYEFVTDSNLKYTVCFLLHTGISSCRVYEMAFGIVGTQKQSLDLRVRATIKAVLVDFWTNNTEAILFVCDSLDNRAKARMVLFDRWFRELNSGYGVVKFDFPASLGVYASLLSYSSNPNLIAVIKELQELYMAMLGQ